MRRVNYTTSADRGQKNLVMETLEPRVMLAADLHAMAYEPMQILNPYADQAVTVEQMIARAQEVPFVTGDLMVALQTPFAADSVQNEFYLDTLRWSDLTGVPASHSSTLMQVDQPDGNSFVLVNLEIGQADLFQTMAAMHETSHVLWTSPNFYLEGDQQDFVPNDPDYGQQYTHPLVGSETAWDFALGDSSIVVGITDDGVDLAHADLSANIWVNTGEISGNGLDDDNNGYIDDVNGWDWANDNNDPSPDGGAHGTHVAGISAARTDNGIGVAGVAGHSTIMPLQFYGGVNGWTASIINNTFTYAADNGAHIVNTSYNINGWVGDPVFTAGMQYMYDNGVLHFNSAGNGSELNPARQAFEQTFLVVSTTAADTKSGFSNYGTGVDISAPGSDVYSTLPGNSYGNNSGTSMAAPNAAGAAALIWSANLSWTRDQVVAQLLGTADNIDAQNPAYAGLMGAGRINVARALTETLAAPRISALVDVPANGGTSNDLTIDSFAISFNQVMDPAAVNNLVNYELRSAGFDGIFGNGDDDLFNLSMPSGYLLSTNQLNVEIDGGPLPFGEYQITVKAGVENPFGTPLDGNGDGTSGDSFVSQFTIAPPPPTNILPQGSLIYEQSFPGNILNAADADQFGIDLDAGQGLTVVVQGSSSLTPVISVYNPANQQVASITGTSSTVATNLLNVDSDGTWTLEVAGDAGSTGDYQLTWLLNTDIESEDFGGPGNDTQATAQRINSSAIDPGTGLADRLAVIGTLPTSDGTPVAQDDFETGSLGSDWSTNSTASGRIQVTGQHGTSSGNFALLMDSSTDSTYSRNEAIWTVDLAGLNSPTLVFDHAEFSDEEDALPQSFVGSLDGDGVSVSDDGLNWYRVFDPASIASGVWEHISIDLVAAANNAGITLGQNFQIKFQQYDNFTLTTDGRGFDNISVNVPDVAADWFAFDLDDGQLATIAATGYSGSGVVLVELFDSAGNLVQTGNVGENVSSYISQFEDSTSNGVTDTWYARVSGQNAGYSLLVTRNAEFDLEPNESSTPLDINDVDGMLGYVSTFAEQNVEPDDFSAGSVLNNAIPGVTLSNPLGGTDVVAETASFGAPTGSLVFSPGSGNSAGWSDGADELRADFDNLTSFVSIDVGSDDSSDVGFLRAYDASNNLLQEVTSGSVATGGKETLTINRTNADIAYIVAAGLGGDITPLDNLVFGALGSEDAYQIDGIAGQEIRFDAFLPGAGPHWFDNGLDTPGGSDLRLDLYEGFGAGALVASGIESIAYTPSQSSVYRLVVTSASGAGEYYLQRSSGPANRFDFGPASSAVQAEWIGVQRDVYDAATGYGWLGPNRALRLETHNGGNDLTGDAFQVAVGTFVVDVPDANYLVTLHFGQTNHHDDVRISIEGGAYVFTPQTNQVEVFKTSVRDGQLTIGFNGNFGIDDFVRVAGIEVVERPSNFARSNNSGLASLSDLLTDAFATLPRAEVSTDFIGQRSSLSDSMARPPVDLALKGMVNELGSDETAEWLVQRDAPLDEDRSLSMDRTGLLIGEVLDDPLAL